MSPGRSENCSTRPATPARIEVLSSSTCACASAASALAFSAGRSDVTRATADCLAAVAALTAPCRPVASTSSNFTKVVQRIPVKIAVDDYKGYQFPHGSNAIVKIHIR